jgi:hypothetical protein
MASWGGRDYPVLQNGTWKRFPRLDKVRVSSSLNDLVKAVKSPSPHVKPLFMELGIPYVGDLACTRQSWMLEVFKGGGDRCA